MSSLPNFPVFVVFPQADYDVQEDKLKYLMEMPFVPDNLGRFLVFPTPELATEFINFAGASSLRVVECQAGRVLEILCFAKPKELNIDPKTKCQVLSLEGAFEWVYQELAKLPLPFPCFAPTDAIFDDFVPLVNASDTDKTKHFWSIFRSHSIATKFGEKNGGGRQRDIYTFTSAHELLRQVHFEEFAEHVDEVWIGDVLVTPWHFNDTLYWQEKMSLDRFKQRVNEMADSEKGI